RAGYLNDASPADLLHLRREQPDHAHHRDHVSVVNLLPLAGGCVGPAAKRELARVVNQDIDAAKSRERLRRYFPGPGISREVAQGDEGFPATGRDLAGHALSALPAPAVHDHRHTFFGQRACDALADAAAASGHQGALAFELQVHAGSPPAGWSHGPRTPKVAHIHGSRARPPVGGFTIQASLSV